MISACSFKMDDGSYVGILKMLCLGINMFSFSFFLVGSGLIVGWKWGRENGASW